jgi:hypothetical protein
LINTFTPKAEDDKEEDGDESDHEVTVKVFMEAAEPSGVKMSKKNCCLINIVSGEVHDIHKKENHKLLEYYLMQKEKNFKNQFLNAFRLGPSVSEDDLIVEYV